MNNETNRKFVNVLLILIFLCIAAVNIPHAVAAPNNLKWDCSAVVYIDNDKVLAEDRYGNIIKQGTAGEADADVIQSAVDSMGPSGEIKICRGKYLLDKPILIGSNIKLTGEGRGTVLVPPVEDYAFKVEKSEKEIIPRPYHTYEGYPLYALIIRDMTIDGEREDLSNSGKGIFLKGFWSSSFENLWIQNTGNAITLFRVHESDFRNIYLINTGHEEKKESGLFISGVDNIHFNGLYVIYQNYLGMKIVKSKLVFINQSMFHGWLPRQGGPAKYPLIQVKDLNDRQENEGRYKADIVIENSRITVGGEGTSAVDIVNSPVTLRQCVATSGFGKTVISATKNARVNISDNSFYSFKPLPAGAYVLYAEDSEIIFKNNVVSVQNLQVCLKAARNTIVANNRFDVKTSEPFIIVGDRGGKGSRSIQINGNFLRSGNLDQVVRVSPLSTSNIDIRNNMLLSD